MLEDSLLVGVVNGSNQERREKMNAPNKIYINVHPLGVDYSIVPIPDFGGVEYIRKDALLDFLASLEKDSARNAGTDDLAYAAHEMVCLLINKIKSL